MAATKTAPKLNVKPLGDKVLIKRDSAETQTDAGIYLPESAKDKPKSGTVEAVGDGALNTETGERMPLAVKKGDRVIFSSFAGSELKLDTENGLLIMSESDILAIIE